MDKKDNIENEATKFHQWFKNSKITDSKGSPLVVYHGTLSVFDSFDPQKNNPESFWGPGFYFSTNIEDINNNYSLLNGPDFNSKKQKLIEELENDEEFNSDINEDPDEDHTPTEGNIYEMEALRRLSVSHEGLIIPVYLSIDKPFDQNSVKWQYSNYPVPPQEGKDIIEYLDSDEFKKFCETNLIDLDEDEISMLSNYFQEFLTYNVSEGDWAQIEDFQSYLVDEACLDEESCEKITTHLGKKFDDFVFDCEIADNEINRYKQCIIEHIEEYEHSPRSVEKFEEIWSSFFENYSDGEQIMAGNLMMKLKDESYNFYDVDSEAPTFMHVTQKFLKTEGYDGIIMEADTQFSNMAIPKGTKHIICFEPKKVKSALGNNGNYSEEEHSILLRVAAKIQENHKIMEIQEIKKHLLSFNDKMDCFMKFRVFDSVEDAKQFLPENADKNTKGFYLDEPGKEFIGIIRNNIENKNDLLTTYVHEAVGHHSVKKVLGDDYEPTMLKLFTYYNKHHSKQFNPEKYTFFSKENKINKAEEFLAVSVERKFNSGFSGIRILVGAVLNKIRKVIPNLPITSFDTDFLEKSAFTYYQKKELTQNHIAQKITDEKDSPNLVLNIPPRKRARARTRAT